MPQSAQYKTSYRVASRLDRFYTGGSICSSVNEECVVCACGDEVKVRFVMSMLHFTVVDSSTANRPKPERVVLKQNKPHVQQ
jgi:hypothetical protein